jgi:hypothetical protein
MRRSHAGVDLHLSLSLSHSLTHTLSLRGSIRPEFRYGETVYVETVDEALVLTKTPTRESREALKEEKFQQLLVRCQL